MTTIVLVLGLLVGSFLNVVIYRLPIMMQRQWRRDCLEMLEQPADPEEDVFNLTRPRSRCPQCGTQITDYSQESIDDGLGETLVLSCSR